MKTMIDKSFKAKRIDNEEWIEGFAIFADNKAFILNSAKVEFIKGYNENRLNFCLYEVIPETVVQYTGLNDINGKKIYNHDIVREEDYIFYVNFGKCGGTANTENFGYMGFYLEPFSEETKRCAQYGLRNDICFFTNIENIGNIHDNPKII